MPLNNAQYNTIMRRFDQRRFESVNAQKKRRDQIYQLIPEFQTIDAEIAAVAASHARARIMGTPTSEIHSTIEALEKKKTHLLTDHGYPADYLEPVYDCPDCRDTGFIGNQKCHCFKQAIVDLVYAQSNIKDRLEEENFDHFNLNYYSTETDPRFGISPRENITYVLDTCKDFIENFDHTFSNLLFYGSTGVGKTFLSNCIARELLNRAHTVIYLSSLSMMEILENHAFHRTDDENDPEDMYSYILDCDLLILDDLGTEVSNAFTTSQLFACLNDRLLHKRSTIISTNLSLDDLQEIYSERIFSRLISNYQVTLILGDDIRIKKVIS